MTNSIYPISGSTNLTHLDSDVWTVDFENFLSETEALTGCTAVLVRVFPPMIDTVSGFVTSAVRATGNRAITVTWTAANLKRNEKYELAVTGVISPTQSKTLVVQVECKA